MNATYPLERTGERAADGVPVVRLTGWRRVLAGIAGTRESLEHDVEDAARAFLETGAGDANDVAAILDDAVVGLFRRGHRS